MSDTRNQNLEKQANQDFKDNVKYYLLFGLIGIIVIVVIVLAFISLGKKNKENKEEPEDSPKTQKNKRISKDLKFNNLTGCVANISDKPENTTYSTSTLPKELVDISKPHKYTVKLSSMSNNFNNFAFTLSGNRPVIIVIAIERNMCNIMYEYNFSIKTIKFDILNQKECNIELVLTENEIQAYQEGTLMESKPYVLMPKEVNSVGLYLYNNFICKKMCIKNI